VVLSNSMHFDLLQLNWITLAADFQGFAADNAKFCLSAPIATEVMQVLEGETLRANPHALAELMAGAYL
jgi:hypothetical protein